jgi:hypothetical protein
MQPVVQLVSVLGQLHCPFAHVPVPQLTPHAPQFCGSLLKFRHDVPQRPWPTPHDADGVDGPPAAPTAGGFTERSAMEPLSEQDAARRVAHNPTARSELQGDQSPFENIISSLQLSAATSTARVKIVRSLRPLNPCVRKSYTRLIESFRGAGRASRRADFFHEIGKYTENVPVRMHSVR